MRRLWLALLLCVGLAPWCPAAPAAPKEKYVAVRVRGFDKSTKYEAMSVTALKELQVQLRREAAVFARAMNNAEKEWAKAEKGRFPGGAVSERTVDELGSTFDSEEEAKKKVSDYEQRDRDTLDRQKEREKDRQKQNRNSGSKNTKSPASVASELERKMAADKARGLFETELTKLLAAKESAAPAAGDAPAEKPADKPAAGGQGH